ncbi:MAG: tRNA uridine-5-carboxymethylaminomethyl(34) synthesis GTPase MnmE [Bacteroidales bacterium]|nr:tRNA uridine-5-carboxymethylaminomethyl(34) synthesis GTPase MnmE [Bacteroidales bacterium]
MTRPSDGTIVAVSTPAGVGGIAVVRVSGSEALRMVLRHLSVSDLSPRHATYCRFDELDDLVAVYFPTGYSGEPTVELSCHGSQYVQQALLQALVDEGAHLAAPGEFTLRAFRHGRLNLSQAEAVADLIDAVTPAQHRLAVSQLRGGYAEQLRQLRQRLLDLTSLMELELDFSQEDVEFANRTELCQLLSTLHFQLSTLIASFRMGNALKRGLPVAIVGLPNAGKSSLLNTLLEDDRAIVSDVPGTTRDTVEELLTLGGVTFRFIDTAGLHRTSDAVESLGIERSLRAVTDARLVLYVHDATTAWRPPELELADKQVIVVMNKCDLEGCQSPVAGCQWPVVQISAKRCDGIDALKQAMLEAVRGELPAEGDVLLSNARHYEALQRVQQALAHVGKGLVDGTPADLLAVDLRDALYHLGAVTGEVANDEILSNVFSRFCVGK